MTSESHMAIYLGALLLAGIASGFAGGFFGIGGGLLRVPIFLYLFPAFSVTEEHVFSLAAGTSLALAIPTCLSSTWRQRKEENLDKELLKAWLPALVVGVVVGLVISKFSSGVVLRFFFVAVLVIQAVYFLIPNSPKISDHLPSRLGIAAISSGIGTLSVMLGLSGGLFTTPTLVAFGQSIHRALATASAGGLLISIVATVGMVINGIGAGGTTSYALGYVDLPALGLMAPAVLLFAPLGVRLANRLPARRLELVFGCLLVVLAADMLREALERY